MITNTASEFNSASDLTFFAASYFPLFVLAHEELGTLRSL